MINRFNIRVYGILLHENRILLAEETVKGKKVVKFPGGGLEFGEGTMDCLRREFKEELGIDILVQEHFYTTDFFVASAFDNSSQVVSIYYIVALQEGDSVSEMSASDILAFRWISADDIGEQDLTLVIDKKVAEMIRNTYSG